MVGEGRRVNAGWSHMGRPVSVPFHRCFSYISWSIDKEILFFYYYYYYYYCYCLFLYRSSNNDSSSNSNGSGSSSGSSRNQRQ